MHPNARIAQFAQWLRDYVDKSYEQVTLNSAGYPLIQDAVKNHHKDLIESVDGEQYYLALATLNHYFHREITHERTVAQSRFEQALLYPDDVSRREAAKKAFLKYDANENNWEALESSLKNLANDPSYIDQNLRTRAHMALIDTVCTDSYISQEAIIDPVVLLKPSGAAQASIYQYDPRFLTYHQWAISSKVEPKHQQDPVTYTSGNLRFLPDLKNALNTFYSDLQNDIADVTEKTHEDILNFAKKIPALLPATEPAVVIEESAPAVPVSITRYQSHYRTDHSRRAFSLYSTQGFILGISPFLGLFFYGIGLLLSVEIPSLHYQHRVNNETISTATTDGEIFSAAIGVTSFLFIIYAVARHQQFFNHHNEHSAGRRAKMAGVIGLASGMFTALFTAKYIDGLTKPSLKEGSTKIDYAFTDLSSVYILMLSLATAALFYKAMGAIVQRSVSTPMQFRRNGASQRLLSIEHQPSQDMRTYI